MMDKDLIWNTAERIKMIVDYAEPNPTFNFKPPISLNGDPNKCINCNCGVELNKDDYFFEGMGRVYTRVGAVKFIITVSSAPKRSVSCAIPILQTSTHVSSTQCKHVLGMKLGGTLLVQ